MNTSSGRKIHITGIVQGVGFRPFVYSLAHRHQLTGWVKNTAAGVDIEVDGPDDQITAFSRALRREPPPLARIDSFDETNQEPQGYTSFQIVHSASNPQDFLPVSPDVSICSDCMRELFDPTDRRYHYPFINCTNCGPRFSIINEIPYDRPNTTMAEFDLCPNCLSEYQDPTNRRFHAQPVACPVCGPTVWLEYTHQVGQSILDDHANHPSHPTQETDLIIQEAQQLILAGKIVAIKGLGGFHLACDATNSEAVIELRNRKLRVDKPFAVMMPDIDTVEHQCILNQTERDLLLSRQRPIVILQRRPGSTIAAQVSPNQNTVGVMLPYTPLHYLLFTDLTDRASPLMKLIFVMTSGNLSEEPIATENEDARQRLAGLCDAFLLHNRPIGVRCDDSVVRVVDSPPTETVRKETVETQHPYLLRRSRGYAPDSIRLAIDVPPVLGVGPELKNTFCLARGSYAFLSHHIGDLENYETLQSFEVGISHFESLFRIQPSVVAYDMHPNYLATRYALERGRGERITVVGIQHHHAHIAACMADNQLSGAEPIIGMAFDGTGYGTDGHIWGGECLISDYRNFHRAAHLKYIPLPGGDAATRQPWRVALAWLRQNNIEWTDDLAPVKEARLTDHRGIDALTALRHQIDHQINTPLTSSAGRLFDAAAALVGVRQTVNYEAQAAIEFEALADPHETGCYPFDILENTEPSQESQLFNTKTYVIDPAPLLHNILGDLREKVPVQVLSARFHNGIAQMVVEVASLLREQTGITQVALSGGVWQNTTLLTKTVVLLRQSNFSVLLHRQVPTNDGAVALGQVVIAAMQLQPN